MQKMFTRLRRFFGVTLLFIFITHYREKTIRKMFCQVCELDFDEPINFGWFQLMAYGNSVSIECHDGYKFTMNDSPNGVKVLSPQGDSWKLEYETATHIESLKWFEKFRLIYDTLTVNDVFKIRQRQNIEKSKQGVMH